MCFQSRKGNQINLVACSQWAFYHFLSSAFLTCSSVSRQKEFSKRRIDFSGWTNFKGFHRCKIELRPMWYIVKNIFLAGYLNVLDSPWLIRQVWKAGKIFSPLLFVQYLDASIVFSSPVVTLVLSCMIWYEVVLITVITLIFQNLVYTKTYFSLALWGALRCFDVLWLENVQCLPKLWSVWVVSILWITSNNFCPWLIIQSYCKNYSEILTGTGGSSTSF